MSKIEIEQNILELLPEFILGFEDDPAGSPPVEGDPDPAGNDDDDPDPSGDNDDDDPDPSEEEEDGRVTALKAERRIRREKEAEAKRLKRENDQLKRKDLAETERLQAELKDAQDNSEVTNAKFQKLVDGYRNNAIRDAIVKEAEKLNFIDTSDAVNYFDGVDKIELFAVEQDEDDPSVITIDNKLVTSALKKLATSKPHYISKGTEDGKASGSPFGGSRRKPDKDEDMKLRELYPNL